MRFIFGASAIAFIDNIAKMLKKKKEKKTPKNVQSIKIILTGNIFRGIRKTTCGGCRRIRVHRVFLCVCVGIFVYTFFFFFNFLRDSTAT